MGRRALRKVDPNLEAEDGQKLGYTWDTVVEFWHKMAFLSFGDGHGVWESSGGTVLPFHARNYLDTTQWLMPLSVERTLVKRIPETEPGTRVKPFRPWVGTDNSALRYPALFSQ